MKSMGVTPKCLFIHDNMNVQTFQCGRGPQGRISVRNCERMIGHPKAPPSPLTPPFNIFASTRLPARAYAHARAYTRALSRAQALACHPRGFYLACVRVRVTLAGFTHIAAVQLTY
jgi:hypothetical protein